MNTQPVWACGMRTWTPKKARVIRRLWRRGIRARGSQEFIELFGKGY
jgi:hypothetical protein